MNTLAYNNALAMLPVMTRTELEEAWENVFDLPANTPHRVDLCRALGDELTRRQRLTPKAG